MIQVSQKKKMKREDNDPNIRWRFACYYYYIAKMWYATTIHRHEQQRSVQAAEHPWTLEHLAAHPAGPTEIHSQSRRKTLLWLAPKGFNARAVQLSRGQK
jgi:hypothetical protein